MNRSGRVAAAHPEKQMNEADRGRVLPHSEEAEKAVLSAMLISGAAVDKVVQILKSPNDFHLIAHRHIYQGMLNLSQAGTPVDTIHLQEELASLGAGRRGDGASLLEDAGGPEYLQHLSLFMDSPANVEYHAQIVRSKSILRSVIQTAGGLLDQAFSPGSEPEELLNEAESAFFTLSQGAESGDFVQMEALMARTMETLEKMEEGQTLLGVDTGFLDLNRLSSGFQKSDLIILAARPSMGKTALAVNFTLHAARSAVPVVIFSLEMSAEQLAYRMISCLSGVEGMRIRTKNLRRDEYPKLSLAVNQLGTYPIFIDETPGITLAELRSKARRAVSLHKAGVVIVDYLQLMTLPKAETHQLGVALVSKSLKALAKELQVPIIALSQLSRQVEQRGGEKRPMLSDLRDSGAIEQDADMVLFVFRPEMYEAADIEGVPTEGQAEVIIGKHRNGPTGTVYMHFEKTTGLFSSVDRQAVAPPGAGAASSGRKGGVEVRVPPAQTERGSGDGPPF